MFFRYWTSPFLRAMETAGNLGLRDADWMINHGIYERNYGVYDRANREEYASELDEKRAVPFYWKPMNGETLMEMCVTRLRGVLDTLARECDGQDVVMVCHGEVIEGLLATFGRMPQNEFVAWHASDEPGSDIRNGQIVQLSRVNPFTGEMEQRLNWHRAFVPLEPEFGYDRRQIIRPRFTSEQLLDMVSATTPLIN